MIGFRRRFIEIMATDVAAAVALLGRPGPSRGKRRRRNEAHDGRDGHTGSFVRWLSFSLIANRQMKGKRWSPLFVYSNNYSLNEKAAATNSSPDFNCFSFGFGFCFPANKNDLSPSKPI